MRANVQGRWEKTLGPLYCRSTKKSRFLDLYRRADLGVPLLLSHQKSVPVVPPPRLVRPANVVHPPAFIPIGFSAEDNVAHGGLADSFTPDAPSCRNHPHLPGLGTGMGQRWFSLLPGNRTQSLAGECKRSYHWTTSAPHLHVLMMAINQCSFQYNAILWLLYTMP